MAVRVDRDGNILPDPSGYFCAVTSGPRPVVAESGPWRPLQELILMRLADSFQRADTVTTERPWRFDLPFADPAWQDFMPYLRHALRAREVTPRDDRFYILRVDTLRITADTARAALYIGGMFRCPGDTEDRGGGSFETLQTVREARGAWSAAQSLRRGHGDSEPCPRTP